MVKSFVERCMESRYPCLETNGFLETAIFQSLSKVTLNSSSSAGDKFVRVVNSYK